MIISVDTNKTCDKLMPFIEREKLGTLEIEENFFNRISKK